MNLLTIISPTLAGSAWLPGVSGSLGVLLALYCAVMACRSGTTRRRRDWSINALVFGVLSGGLVAVAALGGVNAIFGLTPEQLRYLS